MAETKNGIEFKDVMNVIDEYSKITGVEVIDVTLNVTKRTGLVNNVEFTLGSLKTIRRKVEKLVGFGMAFEHIKMTEEMLKVMTAITNAFCKYDDGLSLQNGRVQFSSMAYINLALSEINNDIGDVNWWVKVVERCASQIMNYLTTEWNSLMECPPCK